MSIHIRMRHWLITKHTGSGYRSASGPSFRKLIHPSSLTWH